jgi:microcystin-dependent protein
MSLVKEFDFDDLIGSQTSSGSGNISTTNHTFNSIDTVKYYSTVTNTSEKTFTYGLKSEKLYEYIFSSNDIITLSFNVYLNIFNDSTDIFKIKINDNVIFYFSGGTQVSNEKFTINYLFKSSDLTSILGGADPSLNLIFDGIDSGQSEYVLLDKNFELYAIYKPEFSSITGSNRIITDLTLNDSFDASSKELANGNACEIKGPSSIIQLGSVIFNLNNKLLHGYPVSLFFNLSTFSFESVDVLKIKVSNDSKITLTDSEFAMLQTEFIATTENETEATWYANYVKEGSNGSNSLTNSSTGFQYNSDTNGPYFLVDNSSVNVTLQTYPDVSYLFDMDTTSGAVLCYEIWCYYSGNDGTITSKGWLMGVETGYGPYIVLTDSRIGGIGTTPGANDNNTYTSLNNPGYITDSSNEGHLLHIVGYWEQTSSTNHERGVYINGTHFPQETTTQSSQSTKPGFDSINKIFQVGGRDSSDHSALGVRIYSFRIWHGDIRSKISSLYNAGPHATAITNYRDILELNNSNNKELKTFFYSQTENYDSSYNFNIKFSLTGSIGNQDYVYFDDMFTYIPEAINFFDASGINPSGTITLEPNLLINSNDYVGSIELFDSLPLPDNYLLCDGSVITKSDNSGNYYAPLIDFLNNNTTDNSCCLPNFYEKHALGVDSNIDISNYNTANINHIGNNQLTINYFPSHNHNTNTSSATTNSYNIIVNKLGNDDINIEPTNQRHDIEIKDGSEGNNLPISNAFMTHVHNIDFNNMSGTIQTNTRVVYKRNDTITANTIETISNSQGVTDEINLSNYPLQLESYKLYFGIRFK